jgi:hypothetical protein
MTDTQFEKNREIGDYFWLYVVERAERPDYRIWRIQNPANRVTYFMYDDGWKELAEGEELQFSEIPPEKPGIG